jgi:hypothetical protein
VACHRHGLEVEDEGLLKALVVIFLFLGYFVLSVASFNANVLFTKKTRTTLYSRLHKNGKI